MTRGKTVTRPSAAQYRAHALSPLQLSRVFGFDTDYRPLPGPAIANWTIYMLHNLLFATVAPRLPPCDTSFVNSAQRYSSRQIKSVDFSLNRRKHGKKI